MDVFGVWVPFRHPCADNALEDKRMGCMLRDKTESVEMENKAPFFKDETTQSALLDFVCRMSSSG